MNFVPGLQGTRLATRVLIIVQNLPVPFDRRVWLQCQALISDGYQVAVVCAKGNGDPAYEVINTVELYKYRPYAPGGSKLSFVTEYAYSFLATAWLTLKARRSGRFGVIQACNPPDIFWLIALALRALDGTRVSRCVHIVDEIDGGRHDLRLAFHLGPDVQAELTGSDAFLSWPGASAPGRARLELSRQLRWSLHRGETDPILGWFSRGLGRRAPAFPLIGRGRSAPHTAFATRIHLLDRRPGHVLAVESARTDIPAVPSGST